jgi:hypothetical protein
MGLLFPIYLAGLAALSLPIIFHLVRRTPQGKQDFSSLMFLRPTPPRLTRRSRLDQILLLLMRIAALALIAFAFARPFLRETATLSFDNLPSRRVALVVDTSASLQRDDLWQQSLQLAEKELDDLNEHDDVALYAFSDRLTRLVDFDRPNVPKIPAKPDVVRRQLENLKPSWAATELAAALMAVAADLDSSMDVEQSAAEPQIVLITDLQQGSRFETLQGFEWPQRVRVILRQPVLKQPTNASAHLLPADPDAPDADARVRIVSAADSTSDQFFVAWQSPASQAAAGEAAVYVPPGQSRVIKLPRGTDQLLADRVVLRGDQQPFDNSYFVVPPRKESVKVLYLGADADDDARGQQYYLKLAVAGDPLRTVEVAPLTSASALDDPSAKLAVVTQAVPDDLRGPLSEFAQRGGTVLFAPADEEAARSVASFVGASLVPDRPALKDDQFLLLGDVDFTHPLFTVFANPKYNDFTKVHFWKNWPLQLTGDSPAQVVAKFDNGDPAILENPSGAGRMILLAASWAPDDSQLALSTKFVPLVGSLLDRAFGAATSLPQVVINEPVTLPPTAAEAQSIVRKPDGREVTLPAGTVTFAETDLPGLYHVQAGTESFPFAVNLAASESQTTPLAPEQIEQFGVRFAAQATRTERLDQIRQQRDTELEGRQRIWQWMIAAALALIAAETWWAGRAAGQTWKPVEAVS